MMTDGRQDVNVALNRPSIQVSTHADGYPKSPFVASYANDGNRGVTLPTAGCAHTLLATNPWWAVDLLVALYVAGIRFTNRDQERK